MPGLRNAHTNIARHLRQQAHDDELTRADGKAADPEGQHGTHQGAVVGGGGGDGRGGKGRGHGNNRGDAAPASDGRAQEVDETGRRRKEKKRRKKKRSYGGKPYFCNHSTQSTALLKRGNM
ncbi:hypothetical protein D3C71_1292230 [compost metagenome]